MASPLYDLDIKLVGIIFLTGDIYSSSVLEGDLFYTPLPLYDLDISLAGSIFLIGDIYSSSVLEGDLSQIEAQWTFAGNIPGLSSIVGIESVQRALSAAAAGTSIGNAELSVNLAMLGDYLGTSSISGSLTLVHANWSLTGQVPSNGNLEAIIVADRLIEGILSSNTALNANLIQTEAQWSLTGNIISEGLLSGETIFIPQYDLDIKLSGIHYFEGNIESESSFNAAEMFYFEAEWILEGSNIIANTIIEAKIIVDGFFAGDVVGNGILTADWLYFEAEWALAGDFGEIQSSLSGNLLQTHANWKLAGQIKSISTSNSNLSYIKALNGKIVSDSFFGTAHLSFLMDLSGGMIAGQTFTKEAYLYYQIGLKGSVVGDGLFNANLKGSQDLGGDIIQNSALDASLSKTEAQWQLSGKIEEIISPSFANLTTLHTVTFKDWNGIVLATRIINTGQNANPPNLTIREGYVFIGWSENYFNVINSLETIAIYKIITSIVQYAVGEGGSLSGDLVQSIDYGSSGTAVTALPSPGYKFSQWSDGVLTATRIDTNVTYSKTVTAMFSSLTGGLYNADMLLYRNPLLG